MKIRTVLAYSVVLLFYGIACFLAGEKFFWAIIFVTLGNQILDFLKSTSP